jgi:hypothetical protein
MFASHTCLVGAAGAGSNPDTSTNAFDQIGCQNALNAALAVIKWKKLCGYMDDVTKEHYCAYTIRSNQLISEDTNET